jgi:hypothetical protein
MLLNSRPDNTHLSQRRPLDVVLGRLQRPNSQGLPIFCGSRLWDWFWMWQCPPCHESSKVIIRMSDITNYESDFHFLDKMTMKYFRQ